MGRKQRGEAHFTSGTVMMTGVVPLGLCHRDSSRCLSVWTRGLRPSLSCLPGIFVGDVRKAPEGQVLPFARCLRRETLT